MSNKLFDLVAVLKSFLGRSEDEIKKYIKSPENLSRNGAELATNHVALALSRSKINMNRKPAILFSLLNIDGGDFKTKSCRLILEAVERSYKKLKNADQKAFFRDKQISPHLCHITLPMPQSMPKPKVYPKRTPLKVNPKKEVIVKTVVRVVKIYSARSKTNESLEKLLKITKAKVTRLQQIASQRRTAHIASQQQSSQDLDNLKVKIHFIALGTRNIVV